jgi:hypothetical protein
MTFATLFSTVYIRLAQESQSNSENCECVPQNHFQPGCADFPEAVVFTIEFLSCKGALAAAESTDGLIDWA